MAKKVVTSVTVDLQHSDKLDSLLLGYSIGSADLPHGRKLELVASGKLIRFSVTGCEGYVDIDLSDVATKAAIILTGQEV